MDLKSKLPDGPLAEKWDKHRFEMKLVNPANKRKYTSIVVGTGLAGGAARRPRGDCRAAGGKAGAGSEGNGSTGL